MSIMVYSVGICNGIIFSSQWDVLNTLSQWGFPVNKLNDILPDIHSCINYFHKIDAVRNDLPYQIDGVVLKVNDILIQNKLGNLAHHPVWARACKFKPVQEKTKLINIEVQVGRTGILTPVAIMEPVNIDGVVVSRATLHNMDEIQRKDIRIGDQIIIERAGDVIPRIVKVDESAKRNGTEHKFEMPSNCEVCGSKIIRLDGEAFYRCMGGLMCPAQRKRAIYHFGSRQAMDIDGLGKELVDQLVDAEIIKTPADLYKINKTSLLTLDRIADLSASNLINAIELSKRTTLEKFIFALGIPNVGEETSKTIAKFFGNMERLMDAHPKTMQYLPDIGIEVNKSIHHFFKEKHNREVISQLISSGVYWDIPAGNQTLKITTLSKFLNWLGSRVEAGWQNLIRQKKLENALRP